MEENIKYETEVIIFHVQERQKEDNRQKFESRPDVIGGSSLSVTTQFEYRFLNLIKKNPSQKLFCFYYSMYRTVYHTKIISKTVSRRKKIEN